MSLSPRVSFLGANTAAQLRLRDAYGRLDRANQQVSTTKLYSRPSDDASASSRAALLQDQLDQMNTFDRGIEDARSRLSVADTKAGQAMDIYHRITELATEAASSLNSGSSRQSIREEVLSLQSELVGVANSKYLGNPVFAGLGASNAVAFNAGTSTWTFSGTPADRLTRRVAPGETVDASVTASELFSNGTTDIFTVLDGLATSLANNDTPGIQASLDQVASLQSTLSAAQARIGTSVNRVEDASTRNSAVKLSLTDELSSVQNVDLSVAVTDQNRLSVAYQAALGVTAKASQQTLLDWLR